MKRLFSAVAIWMVGFVLASFPLHAGDSSGLLQVTLKLRDGSVLRGTMKEDELLVATEAIGGIKIPFSRVTTIKFGEADKSDSIVLTNGDKLKGSIRLTKIGIEAIFGRVSVLKEVLVELQVRVAGKPARQLDWEQLPFFQDSDWPGDRGRRAEVQDDGSIVFHGQPVLSREVYTLPLTIEYDVTCPAPRANLGGLTVAAFQPDQRTDMDVRDAVMFSLGYGNREEGTVSCNILRGTKRGTPIGRERPVELTPGKTYRCRLTMGVDEVRFDVGEQSYQLEGVKIPYDRFKIWIWGWMPSAAWRVSNITVQ